MKQRRLDIRITADDHEFLKSYCALNETSISAVIRSMIHDLKAKYRVPQLLSRKENKDGSISEQYMVNIVIDENGNDNEK